MIANRLLLILPLLGALGACAQDPAGGDYLFGSGDPVRGAAFNAPRNLGDMTAYHGNPAGAAMAAAQLEFLARSFTTDGRFAQIANFGTIHAVRQGQREMRGALGIPMTTDAAVVEENLRNAALALRAGSRDRAEAALAGYAPDILARLSNLPRMPRVAEAAGAASVEMNQGRSGRGGMRL